MTFLHTFVEEGGGLVNCSVHRSTFRTGDKQSIHWPEELAACSSCTVGSALQINLRDCSQRARNLQERSTVHLAGLLIFAKVVWC